MHITVHFLLTLTLETLRVISIKFLLVMSTPYKTEWVRELRTGSCKMNLLDISIMFPYYSVLVYEMCRGNKIMRIQILILGLKGLTEF